MNFLPVVASRVVLLEFCCIIQAHQQMERFRDVTQLTKLLIQSNHCNFNNQDNFCRHLLSSDARNNHIDTRQFRIHCIVCIQWELKNPSILLPSLLLEITAFIADHHRQHFQNKAFTSIFRSRAFPLHETRCWHDEGGKNSMNRISNVIIHN